MNPSLNIFAKTNLREDEAGDAEVAETRQKTCPTQARGENSHRHVLLTKGQHHGQGGEQQTNQLRKPLGRS